MDYFDTSSCTTIKLYTHNLQLKSIVFQYRFQIS